MVSPHTQYPNGKPRSLYWFLPEHRPAHPIKQRKPLNASFMIVFSLFNLSNPPPCNITLLIRAIINYSLAVGNKLLIHLPAFSIYPSQLFSTQQPGWSLGNDFTMSFFYLRFFQWFSYWHRGKGPKFLMVHEDLSLDSKQLLSLQVLQHWHCSHPTGPF